jgi:hypothetical protein
MRSNECVVEMKERGGDWQRTSRVVYTKISQAMSAAQRMKRSRRHAGRDFRVMAKDEHGQFADECGTINL